MNTRHNPLDNYKRYLVSTTTSNTAFVEFVEYCLASEDDAANYCFHKIMVHNWPGTTNALYDALMKHFNTMFIPVEPSSKGEITSFYTTSLFLVNKIMRFEFIFLHERTMFNVDILFNDRSAEDLLYNRITIDDIISGVVSRRFSDTHKLDLSRFCKDSEFKEKNIDFYKLSLLANFKLLMLRIGRETKELDLSRNNLKVPPLEILNFFIKGDLTAINLSDNNIKSISDLMRVSSKIEKLWLEGNPLCDDILPNVYIKQLTTKFPRLMVLDGVKLNNHNVPIIRNFMSNNTNSVAKMVIDKFLSLYYTCYDATALAINRPGIEGFYSEDAKFSISLIDLSQSVRDTDTVKAAGGAWKRRAAGKTMVTEALHCMPQTKHDPTTFTVDILEFNNTRVIIVVEGVFQDNYNNLWKTRRFRRTFLFRVAKNTMNTTFFIVNDLLTVIPAFAEDENYCFKVPLRHLSPWSLVDPDQEDINTFITIFVHLTQLKKDEAEARLRIHNWNIKEALQTFLKQYEKNRISLDKFIDDDEVSDLSLTEDELD